VSVAALYVDPRGPYPRLLGADRCWDATRDARTYAGPWPVVAHPACGPWGRLSHLYQGGEGGPELGALAVEQVRQWGGVLEHPEGSRLWDACDLPRPGAPPDAWGGHTIAVNQCDWGHVAQKPTWLYLVRVDPEVSAWRPPTRTPTHWVCGSRNVRGAHSRGGVCPPGIRFCSAQQRRRTPPLFAEWLALMAESVTP
jgi:hypothetical protein